MFSSDRTIPFQDLFKKSVQHLLADDLLLGIRFINHHVDVYVAIACMAKAGNGDSEFLLQTLGKFKQSRQATSRNHYVFIQFSESGIPQRAASGPSLLFRQTRV